MKDEYISISEFAKRAGVSRPTIYKKLEDELSTYCKVVKGKKLINIKALGFFGVNENVKNFTESEALLHMVTVLETQTKLLKDQLAMKDRQIEELNARLKESNQSLRAITHKELLEINDKTAEEQEKQGPVFDFEDVESTPGSVESVKTQPEAHEIPVPELIPDKNDDQELYESVLSKLPKFRKMEKLLFLESCRKKLKLALAGLTDDEKVILYDHGFDEEQFLK